MIAGDLQIDYGSTISRGMTVSSSDESDVVISPFCRQHGATVLDAPVLPRLQQCRDGQF
jgi:hypothetical protein